MARSNIPPVTRILLGTLFSLSFLSFLVRYKQWTASSDTILVPYLTLIPQLSLIYPWTFLITTLVESNIFTLSIAALTLFHGGRYLERAWSSREFTKFILITALVPNTLCFAVLVVFFTFTRDETWTYVTNAHVTFLPRHLYPGAAQANNRPASHPNSLTTIAGTIPLQISFLVAFSQLVPAHTVTLFRGLLSLRVPRFPLLYLALVLVLALTPLLTAAAFYLALFGFFTSFTYLRFYKPVFPDLDASQNPYSNSSNSSAAQMRGDAAETFALAEFFPAPAKPFVAAASDAVFNTLVALGLCAPFPQASEHGGAHQQQQQHHGGGGGGYQQSGHRGAPGSARAEAERRRALALKALDQRLQAATAGGRGGGADAGATRSVSPAPPPPAKMAAPAATGPTVQSQPASSQQTAMTSRPSDGMLGEMNYNPDDEGGDNKSEA